MGNFTRLQWLARAIVIIMATIAFVLATIAVAPRAHAQDDDGPDAEFDSRVVSSETTYQVVPDAERIEVKQTITIRNVRGSTRSGNIVTEYFWTGHTVWIAPDARDISIMSNGGELTYEEFDEVEDLVKIYSVDFPSNLFFGQTRVLDVSYVLPSYTDDGPRRINSALLDFNLITCCNFEEITIEVLVPNDFIVVPPEDGGFTESTSAGAQVFSYSDSELSGDFTDFVISDWFAFNLDGFDTSTVALGGADARILGYPDDPAWLQDMTELVEAVVGTMRELTGNDWSQAEPEFQQVADGASAAIDDNGVETWLADDSLSFVPSTIPEQAVALSMARPYVNDSNFELSWMTEATVRAMTSEAVAKLPGATRSEPRAPTGLISTAAEGEWFVRQITDEIGFDGLRELERLAGTAETAFVGTDDPELSVTIDNDWRRLLDLAEQRMSMTGIGLIMESTLLSDDHVDELATRNDAIERYDALRARVGIDEGPIGLRSALTNWQFDDVNEMIDAANASLDDAQALAGEAADAGLEYQPDELAGWTQHASVDDFRSLTNGFDDRRAAIDDIVAAEARLGEDRGYVSSLGFDEAGATKAIADARSAFNNDRLEGVEDSLASFAAIEADASSSGRSKLITRMIVPIAAVVLLLIGGLFFWRRRRASSDAPDPSPKLATAGAAIVAPVANDVIDLRNAPPPAADVAASPLPSTPQAPPVDAPPRPASNVATDTTVVPAPGPGSAPTQEPDPAVSDDGVVEF